VAVTLVERVAALNPSGSGALIDATDGFTLVATPQAGDVVVIATASTNLTGGRTISSITGLGATWTLGYQGSRNCYWIGTGANAAGSPTVTMSGNGQVQGVMYLLRGLTSTATSGNESSVSNGTSLAGPALSAGSGQFVISTVATSSNATLTFPSAQTPSGWTASSPVGTGASAGEAYRIPGSAAESHFCTAATSSGTAIAVGTFVIGEAVTIPARTAALSGAGTLSAAARQVAVRATALAGAGTLAATTLAVVPVSASPSGTGELSASAYAVGGAIPRDAALAGSGTLSAASAATTPAALSGSGSLSAAARAVEVRTAGLSGSGSLAASAYDATAPTVTVSLTGTGTLSAVAVGIGPLGTDTTNGAHFRHRGGWAVAEWEPAPTPLPLPATAHSVMVASAFGPVTMQGAQPTFTTSQAYATRLRQRILIGGVDMTVHRGVLAPDVDFQLADPLLYGPATVTLPSISAVFEQGAHPNLGKGKRVKVQLVDDNNVVQHTLYKGFVLGPGVGGRNLTLDVGGEAQGRASQMDKQPPIFRDVLDLSRIAWRAIADLGLRYLPRLGEPGIGIRSLNFGGTGMLEHIEEIISRATKKDGTQRTIMPDADGVYRLVDKDTTTVHYTLFVDDAHVVPDLRSDMSEEPNRIYATTVTPAGMRVRFGAYPGLIQGPAPEYPMADDSYFGVGTTDEDTDTGDGISVLINRLGAVGLLDIRDTPGGFDDDVADAVNKLGRKAGATAPVGTMTPGLWSALWDLDVTGYDRKWSSIQPAAELDEVRRFDRSSSGAVIGLNDEFDTDAIKVDRSVDMGSGFTRKQAADFSETLLSDGDEWFGTVTVNTWAVLAGQVDVGATITAADLVDARLVKPGDNLWLPNFAGGILVHVSGVDVSGDRVSYTVDTRARPAREVWERIQVRRETRRDPSRRWLGNRQSTRIKDAVQGFDEVGGVIDRDIPLDAGHNVLEVVAGDYGTIRAIRTLVQTVTRDGGEISIDPHEHAVYVFGKEPSAERLNALIGNPLTTSGERAIRRSAKAYLDSRRLLYSAGTQDEPCGYGRDLKSDGATLTGEHIDDSGFSYVADNGCTLFLVVYVGGATTLRKGRAMWPQLEGGV
jgi:hypothetical protein